MADTSCFWAVNAVQSAFAGTYNGGNGSAEKPYRISTPQNMNEIGTNPGDRDKHFVLTDNIDLSAYTGTQFHIIGSYSARFAGVFDGNGFTVSNFTYTTTTDSGPIGLFGYVDDANAVIKDLTLVAPNVNSTGGADFICPLVGWLCSGTITGCGIEGGSVSGADSGVGGLAGRNDGTISNCHAAASVTGNDNETGGLVGVNFGTISNSYATGSVTGGDWSTGGLAGAVYEGTISNCYATGSVTASGNYTGGLVGYGEDNTTITNCYATGSVTGGEYCTGGLVGYNSDSTISASFWDVEIGGPDNGIGTPLPTSQMQTMTTFTGAGWDFVGEQVNGTDDIWSIHEGTDYPVFVWEIVNFVGWYEVDMADFAFFASHWMDTDCGGPDACEGTDIDFSGSVDLTDLLIFTNRWLIGK